MEFEKVGEGKKIVFDMRDGTQKVHDGILKVSASQVFTKVDISGAEDKVKLIRNVEIVEVTLFR